MKLTIHLLHDDQPTGARIAKIDQWTCTMDVPLCRETLYVGEVVVLHAKPNIPPLQVGY